MRNLESLEAWRLSRSVATRAYRLTLDDPLKKHFGVADQVRRAAISVPANITEGYAQGTRPQLVRFVRIALGSAAELKGHLQIVAELGLAENTSVQPILADADRVVGLLVGLLKSVHAKVPGKGY